MLSIVLRPDQVVKIGEDIEIYNNDRYHRNQSISVKAPDNVSIKRIPLVESTYYNQDS